MSFKKHTCCNCGEERAEYKIIKGKDKNYKLCDDCLEFWKEIELEDMYEDL